MKQSRLIPRLWIQCCELDVLAVVTALACKRKIPLIVRASCGSWEDMFDRKTLRADIAWSAAILAAIPCTRNDSCS